MMFGPKNAPSCFQRFMDMAFEAMLRQKTVAVYIDDIAAGAATFDHFF